MKFTQTYSNAQTLTNSTVNAIAQSCASLKSKFTQKSSSNTSCSCSCRKNYGSITSKLHEIALSTGTEEHLIALSPIHLKINPPFSNSLVFSQNSFNVQDSFKEINKILSYGMEKSKEDLSTAVQDHFNSLRHIHDSIATTVAAPKITLDCSLVGEFFGMAERNAREIVAEEDVYSSYMVDSFFGLVESKCLESTSCADYSLPQFYKMAKPQRKVPITESTVIESYDFVSFISLVESDLRVTENTSDFGMMAEYLAMKNNPVPEEAVLEPLVEEISQLIESIVSTTDDQTNFDLPAFLAFSEVKTQEVTQLDALIEYSLPQFYKMVNLETKVSITESTVIENYDFISFISSIESDIEIIEPASDSGMMAEYLSMKNNPVPEEAIYDPLVAEISQLIESIVSTADIQSLTDYLPAFLALSEAKTQEDTQFGSLNDYSLPQFYKMVNLEAKEPVTEPTVIESYDFVSFISSVQSDIKFVASNTDSGMMAEYLAMKNNPVPKESNYDPLVGEISELIESIMSTADNQDNFDYFPAIFALSEGKKEEVSKFDAFVDYSLPQFYELVNSQTKPTRDKIYETDMVASFITMNEKTVKRACISHQKLQKNKHNSWFARGLHPLPPHYQELSKFAPCQTRDTTTAANRLYCKIGPNNRTTRITPKVEYTPSQTRDAPVSDILKIKPKKITQESTARINPRIKLALKTKDVPTGSDRYIKPRNILGESTRFNQQANAPRKPKVEKYSYNRNNSIFLELDIE